jgi:hypothetical protein
MIVWQRARVIANGLPVSAVSSRVGRWAAQQTQSAAASDQNWKFSVNKTAIPIGLRKLLAHFVSHANHVESPTVAEFHPVALHALLLWRR